MKKSPIVIAVAALLLAACASTPTTAPVAQTPTPVSQPSGGVTTVDVTQTNPSMPASRVSAAELPGAIRNAPDAKTALALLQGHSVYFDFDQSVVRDDQRGVVEGNAIYLNRFNGKVLLQGNTDASGSREYNLALGQRRAESVKQSMEVLGVKPQQIEAVSFGKEKPRAEGTSDEANAENRRVDFVQQ